MLDLAPFDIKSYIYTYLSVFLAVVKGVDKEQHVSVCTEHVPISTEHVPIYIYVLNICLLEMNMC